MENSKKLVIYDDDSYSFNGYFFDKDGILISEKNYPTELINGIMYYITKAIYVDSRNNPILLDISKSSTTFDNNFIEQNSLTLSSAYDFSPIDAEKDVEKEVLLYPVLHNGTHMDIYASRCGIILCSRDFDNVVYVDYNTIVDVEIVNDIASMKFKDNIYFDDIRNNSCFYFSENGKLSWYNTDYNTMSDKQYSVLDFINEYDIFEYDVLHDDGCITLVKDNTLYKVENRLDGLNIDIEDYTEKIAYLNNEIINANNLKKLYEKVLGH